MRQLADQAACSSSAQSSKHAWYSDSRPCFSQLEVLKDAVLRLLHTKHRICVCSVLYLAVLLSGAVTTLGALYLPLL